MTTTSNPIMVLADVALLLGDGWTATSDGPHYVFLRHNDGRQITGRHDSYRHRIILTGAFPRDSGGRDPIVITVADHRTAAAIAADMRLRFLPRYTAAWEGACDRAARTKAQAEARATLIGYLASCPGTRRASDYDRHRVYLDGYRGHIEARNDGQSVNITLNDVPASAAFAILAILSPGNPGA